MSRGAFFFGLAVIAVLIVSLYRAKSGAKETAGELVVVEEAIVDATREKALLETELRARLLQALYDDFDRDAGEIFALDSIVHIAGFPTDIGEMKPRDVAHIWIEETIPWIRDPSR